MLFYILAGGIASVTSTALAAPAPVFSILIVIVVVSPSWIVYDKADNVGANAGCYPSRPAFAA